MIIIVDYGTANIGSVLSMGRKAGGQFRISSDPDDVAAADKLILPGVGAFDHGMANLHDRGLAAALNHAVLERKVPILGICLGVQLFARRSEEGVRPGLGWIAADTVKFRAAAAGSRLKVPHMGWNHVIPAKDDPLLIGLPDDPRFYFVHSYHLVCDDVADVLTWTDHGCHFASAVRHDNIWGTQFHPEKSHKFGLALMRNFIAM